MHALCKMAFQSYFGYIFYAYRYAAALVLRPVGIYFMTAGMPRPWFCAVLAYILCLPLCRGLRFARYWHKFYANRYAMAFVLRGIGINIMHTVMPRASFCAVLAYFLCQPLCHGLRFERYWHKFYANRYAAGFILRGIGINIMLTGMPRPSFCAVLA